MTSWKTTASGVLAVVPQILQLLFPKYITPELAGGLSTLFVALGLVVAKDKNVTGGTVVNSNNDASIVAASASTKIPS